MAVGGLSPSRSARPARTSGRWASRRTRPLRSNCAGASANRGPSDLPCEVPRRSGNRGQQIGHTLGSWVCSRSGRSSRGPTARRRAEPGDRARCAPRRRSVGFSSWLPMAGTETSAIRLGVGNLDSRRYSAAHRASGSVGTVRCSGRDRGARAGPRRAPPPDSEAKLTNRGDARSP
jgi:hypothetical protein